ncbi:hypothetical protein FRC11_005732 [Ceratobasidium sp. 423]|nr:hypothetical protein FRC11_005732 [Ceratobasidium sp. 423]
MSALVQRDTGSSASPTESGDDTSKQTLEQSIYTPISIAPLVENLQTKFSKQLLDLGKFDVQGVERKIPTQPPSSRQ